MKTTKIFRLLLMAFCMVVGTVSAFATAPLLGITAFATSPIVTDLEAYAGRYKEELFSTLINKLNIANDVTVETMVKSKLKFTKLTVSDGFRPYSSTEQIEGDELNYSGIDLEVLTGKRELSIEVKKYLNTWMQEQKRAKITGAKTDIASIPFAEYVWNQVIMQMASEINNKTAYFGFDLNDAVPFDAGDTYAVGDYVTFTVSGISHYYRCQVITTAGQSPTTTPASWKKVNAEAVCPGLGYHLAALITAGDVVETTTGALTEANAYDHLWTIWKAVPEAYKENGVKCYLSRSNYENFVKQYETDVSKYTDKDGSTVKTLPGTDGKCEFVIASWMAGSGRVIMTPKENVYMGTNEMSDMNEIETVKAELWTIKAGISCVIGFKFRDAAAITCNDVA